MRDFLPPLSAGSHRHLCYLLFLHPRRSPVIIKLTYGRGGRSQLNLPVHAPRFEGHTPLARHRAKGPPHGSYQRRGASCIDMYSGTRAPGLLFAVDPYVGLEGVDTCEPPGRSLHHGRTSDEESDCGLGAPERAACRLFGVRVENGSGVIVKKFAIILGANTLLDLKTIYLIKIPQETRVWRSSAVGAGTGTPFWYTRHTGRSTTTRTTSPPTARTSSTPMAWV